MKKRSLKILCLVLLFALLIPTLSACNGGSEAPSASPSESASPSQSEAPSAEPSPEPEVSEAPPADAPPADAQPTPEPEVIAPSVETKITLPLSDERLDYTFWTGIDPRVVDLVEADNYTDAFAVFNEVGRQTNIYLDITGVPAFVESEKFNLMIAAGDYCDVIFGIGNLYTTRVPGALEDEIIIDVRDLLEEYAPVYWNTIMSSSELKIASFTEEGKIGAILQTYKEAGTENPGYALRKDWLDSFGMDIPETVDEFYAFLTAAHDEYGAQMFIRGGTGLLTAADYANLQYAYGAQENFYLKNGELSYGPVQPEYYEYLETLSKWYAEGLLQEDYYSRDLSQGQADFGKGLLSTILVNSAAGISELYNYALDGRDSMDIAAFGNLTIPGKDALVVSRANTLIKNGSIWSISKDCKDPIPLIELINFLYTEEGSLICNYGIQGETFVMNSDGEPEWTDVVLNNPDGLTTTQAMIIFASGNLPYVHDMSRTYYDFDESQWDAVELYKGDDVDMNSLPLDLSIYLNSVESERLSLLTTEVRTYTAENVQSWVCNVKPLDQASFDEFSSTLYAMLNLQEITDLTQVAYDRYLERLAEIG